MYGPSPAPRACESEPNSVTSPCSPRLRVRHRGVGANGESSVYGGAYRLPWLQEVSCEETAATSTSGRLVSGWSVTDLQRGEVALASIFEASGHLEGDVSGQVFQIGVDIASLGR